MKRRRIAWIGWILFVCAACRPLSSPSPPVLAWHPLGNSSTTVFDDAPYYPADTPFIVEVPSDLLMPEGSRKPRLSIENRAGQKLVDLPVGTVGSEQNPVSCILRLPTGDGLEPFFVRLRTDDNPEIVAEMKLIGVKRSIGFRFGSDRRVLPRTGEWLEWCRRSCLLTIPFPLIDGFLTVSGNAPIECFPGERWELRFRNAEHTLRIATITSADFRESVRIDPSGYWLARSGERVWDVRKQYPEDDYGIFLESDSEFVPSRCVGGDDSRVLSFSLRQIEWNTFIPLEGMVRDDPGKDSRLWWTQSRAIAMIPLPVSDGRLLMQGIRSIGCIPEPQEVRLTLDGREIFREWIEAETFFIEIPVGGATGEGRLEITVEPIFFKGGCSDSDDPSPYGVGVLEILVAG